VSSSAIKPFRIAVDESVLADLHSRLERTRWPSAIAVAGWDYGVDMNYLRTLVAYWRCNFDWRKQERQLNQFDQFRTTIDGQCLHFMHIRSRHADATPLMLVHGWPGSVVEFLDVIAPLVTPEEHLGSAADAFHLVIPSLPGYGFSGPTEERGWNPRRTAAAYVELMQGLGYGRYLAQGGDWGAFVVDEMALLDPTHMVGLHTNLPVAPLAPQAALSTVEQLDVADFMRWHAEESAYALLQGTKPQTFGVALEDSPAALLGLILEKVQAWSDNGLERTISRDRLLTNVMFY